MRPHAATPPGHCARCGAWAPDGRCAQCDPPALVWLGVPLEMLIVVGAILAGLLAAIVVGSRVS